MNNSNKNFIMLVENDCHNSVCSEAEREGAVPRNSHAASMLTDAGPKTAELLGRKRPNARSTDRVRAASGGTPVESPVPEGEIAGSTATLRSYGGFVEAMRLGRVLEFDIGGFRPLDKTTRHQEWAVPSFDFGHLIDPSHIEHIRGRIPFDIYEAECIRKDIAFIFDIGRFSFILLNESGGPTLFFEVRDEDADYFAARGINYWIKLPELSELAQYAWLELSYLLENPLIVQIGAPQPTSVAKANRRRHMAKKKPLPATAIMNLTRTQYVGAPVVAKSPGVGSPKRPHDRAGHWRNYQNGKRVWIEGFPIHPGASGPTNFIVKP